MKYYKLARNLLRSYRCCAKKTLPFAILTDRVNEYTSEFDDVILLKDKPNSSFLDKLYLAEYIPYNETIFIDADSLCVSDPVNIFMDFEGCGDVSFYGWLMPLDHLGDWFDYNKCGEYKDKIKYKIGGHGGLVFFRKNENSRTIMCMARHFVENYEKYGFNYFEKPADEPVIAMAMAVSGAKPCQKEKKITFWPRYRSRLRINSIGNIFIDNQPTELVVLHFGTPYTQLFTYNWLNELIKHNYFVDNHRLGKKRYIKLKLKLLPLTIKKTITHSTFVLLKRILPKYIFSKLL